MAVDLALGWHVPVAVSDDYDRQFVRHESSSSSPSGAATSASAETEGGDEQPLERGVGDTREGGAEPPCRRCVGVGGVAGPNGSHGRHRGREHRSQHGLGGGSCPHHQRRHEHRQEQRGDERPRRRSASPPASFPVLLPAPSTPFAGRSLRSRSYQSAVYYGECRLRGIDSRMAEEGALEVADRHRRWWVERTAARARRRNSAEGGRRFSTDSTAEDDDEEGRGGGGGGGISRRGGGSDRSRSKRRRRRSLRKSRSSKNEKRLAAGGVPSSPPRSPVRSSVVGGPPRTLTPSPPPSPLRSGSQSSSSSSEGGGGGGGGHPPPRSASAAVGASEADAAKADLLNALSRAGGDVSDPAFRSSLDRLSGHYRSGGIDARRAFSPDAPSSRGSSGPSVEGTWLSISRPEYEDCLGRHPTSGDFLYTLGRMAFDMFRPTHLVCSIRGIYNAVGKVDGEEDGEGGCGGNGGPEYVPHGLRGELGEKGGGGAAGLRTYNIVVAFTVEPNQTRNGEPRSPPSPQTPSSPPSSAAKVHPQEKGTQGPGPSPPEGSSAGVGANASAAASEEDYVVTEPIRGVMTNYGYVLPDPSVPNRFSIWFTGGTLEFDDCQEEDQGEHLASTEADGSGGEEAPDAKTAADDDRRRRRLLDAWRQTFDPRSAPRRTPLEYARVLAARVLLGASVPDSMGRDGSLSYVLRRPIGGHGLAYVDVLYMDDELRVMRGHRDQVYVCARVDGGGEEDGGEWE